MRGSTDPGGGSAARRLHAVIVSFIAEKGGCQRARPPRRPKKGLLEDRLHERRLGSVTRRRRLAVKHGGPLLRIRRKFLAGASLECFVGAIAKGDVLFRFQDVD